MIQFLTTLKMMYWKYIAEDIATSADFICCHRLQTIIQQCKISLTKALLGLNLRAPSNFKDLIENCIFSSLPKNAFLIA